MDLEELRIFARVAELESFTRAGDQLGLAKGRVSTAGSNWKRRSARGCCSARRAATSSRPTAISSPSAARN